MDAQYAAAFAQPRLPATTCAALPRLGRRLLVWAQLAVGQLDPARPPAVGRVEHGPGLALGTARQGRQVARPELARLVPAFRSAPRSGSPIAPRRPALSAAFAHAASTALCTAVKAYGNAVGRRATPHHFRHLKASTLLNRGASLSEVQDILGHASAETTLQIYAHYTPQFLRETVAKYSASAAELAAELEAEQERRRAQGEPARAR